MVCGFFRFAAFDLLAGFFAAAAPADRGWSSQRIDCDSRQASALLSASSTVVLISFAALRFTLCSPARRRIAGQLQPPEQLLIRLTNQVFLASCLMHACQPANVRIKPQISRERPRFRVDHLQLGYSRFLLLGFILRSIPSP